MSSWDELLEHMETSCMSQDIQHRSAIQNKMASFSEDMCKEVAAHTRCQQCPKFVEPDSTLGAKTWDELLG